MNLFVGVIDQLFGLAVKGEYTTVDELNVDDFIVRVKALDVGVRDVLFESGCDLQCQ